MSLKSPSRDVPYLSLPSQLISVVKLDRVLTYRQHLESQRKKLTTRVSLLRRLAGSSWGAGAMTLRIATLALVHSAAEYCAPVWSRSAHTRLIDKPINDALRIVTGCLRPTPTDNLYVLAGIQPSELRRKQAVLSLACRAQEPEHLLHNRLSSLPYGGHRQLKSRHPFVPAALELLNDLNKANIGVAHWADYRWNMEWQGNTSRLHQFIADVSSSPSGMNFPRPAWVRLNRLRTGVGLFRSTMYKWGMAPTAACECGAEEQTADHVIATCPSYCYPNWVEDQAKAHEKIVAWLTETCPAI